MKPSVASLFLAAALACSTKAQEPEIPAAQEQVHTKGAPLSLEEKLRECQEDRNACTKGIEAAFPSFYSPAEITISDEEKKALSDLLSLELPADVAYQNAKKNACRISLSFYYDNNLLVQSKDGREYGTCIFLTENLALSAFHMVRSMHYYFFKWRINLNIPHPEKFDLSGFARSVQNIVAIAPFYDLVLLRTEAKMNASPVPLGKFNESNPTLSYVSLQQKKDYVYFFSEGVLQVVEKYDQPEFNEKGDFIPPRIDARLTSGAETKPGFSGSPVLQGGKLIGMVWGSDHFADNKQSVSIAHYLPEFISQVLAKPAREKE